MNKSEFVIKFVETFGYTNVEVKTYKGSGNNTIWEIKAFKKDARGDRNVDFQESGFEWFIKNLSQILWRQN